MNFIREIKEGKRRLNLIIFEAPLIALTLFMMIVLNLFILGIDL